MARISARGVIVAAVITLVGTIGAAFIVSSSGGGSDGTAPVTSSPSGETGTSVVATDSPFRSTDDLIRLGVVPGLSRSECDPTAWAEAARLYANERGRSVSWQDPDGDCLNTWFEVNRSGSLPDDGDQNSNGIIDGLDFEVGGSSIPELGAQLPPNE